MNRDIHIGEIQLGKCKSGNTNGKYNSENTNRELQVETIQLGTYKSEITNQKIQLWKLEIEKTKI